MVLHAGHLRADEVGFVVGGEPALDRGHPRSRFLTHCQIRRTDVRGAPSGRAASRRWPAVEARGRDPRRAISRAASCSSCYLDRIDRLNGRRQRGRHARRRSRPSGRRRGRRRHRARRTMSARCTVCRSRSRTRSRPRASARPAARRELADHVPTHDAPAVARLKAAGAIVFGKTNLPRWSGDVADLQRASSAPPTTRGTFDRITGGSSGGAAAAVAAGFTSFELGTDIGGSVRIPSHCCGVFGLKPSFGVVPQRGYLDHVGGGTTDADINVFGPIARSADDLDLLLDVLAGPDARARRRVAPRAAAVRGAHRSPSSARHLVRRPRVVRRAPSTARCSRAAADALADAGAKRRRRPPAGRLRASRRACSSDDRGGDVAERCPTRPPRRWPGSHLAWLRGGGASAPRSGASGPSGSSSHDLLLLPGDGGAAVPARPRGQHHGPHDRGRRRAARRYQHRSPGSGLIGVVGPARRRWSRSAAPPPACPVGMQIVAPVPARPPGGPGGAAGRRGDSAATRCRPGF